jgi:hypothetical protein
MEANKFEDLQSQQEPQESQWYNHSLKASSQDQRQTIIHYHLWLLQNHPPSTFAHFFTHLTNHLNLYIHSNSSVLSHRSPCNVLIHKLVFMCCYKNNLLPITYMHVFFKVLKSIVSGVVCSLCLNLIKLLCFHLFTQDHISIHGAICAFNQLLLIGVYYSLVNDWPIYLHKNICWLFSNPYHHHNEATALICKSPLELGKNLLWIYIHTHTHTHTHTYVYISNRVSDWGRGLK